MNYKIDPNIPRYNYVEFKLTKRQAEKRRLNEIANLESCIEDAKQSLKAFKKRPLEKVAYKLVKVEKRIKGKPNPAWKDAPFGTHVAKPGSLYKTSA